MRHLLYHDLKRIVNIKRTLLTGLVAVIALFFFVQFFSEDMTEDRLLEKLHIGVIDLEQTELSRMLIQSFHSNDKFTALVEITKGDQKHVMDVYETGRLTAVITIPETFTTSLLHYENEPLQVIINPDHTLRASVFSEMLKSYSDYIRAVDASTYGLYTTLKEANFPQDQLKQTNDLYSLEMISTALGRNRIFSYSPVKTFPATTSGVYFGAAILVMISVFSSSGILPLVFEDLRLNCTQRYMTLNHNLVYWLASKLIALSLNATLLCFIIGLPIIFIFNMGLNQSLLLFIQILILNLCFASIALSLGFLIKNEASATVTSNLLYFVLGLAGGNFIPIPLMPKSVQDISAFTPNYWAIKTLLNNIAGLPGSYTMQLVPFLACTVLLTLICSLQLSKSLHEGSVQYD